MKRGRVIIYSSLMVLMGFALTLSLFSGSPGAQSQAATATSITNGQPWIWPEPTATAIGRTPAVIRFRHEAAIEAFNIYPDLIVMPDPDRTGLGAYPVPEYPTVTPTAWPTPSIRLNVTPGSIGGNLPRPPTITPTPEPRDDTLLTPWPQFTPTPSGGP